MGTETAAFPAGTFTIPGDPGAIRGAAQGYRATGGTAHEVGATLGALTSPSWVGVEGVTYRTRLAEFPPVLSAADTSLAEAATALLAFADAVAQGQVEMEALRAAAEATFASAGQARARQEALAAAGTPSTGVPAPMMTGANEQVATLEAACVNQRAQAAAIRARVEEAARACGARIGAVAACPPVPPPVPGASGVTGPGGTPSLTGPGGTPSLTGPGGTPSLTGPGGTPSLTGPGGTPSGFAPGPSPLGTALRASGWLSTWESLKASVAEAAEAGHEVAGSTPYQAASLTVGTAAVPAGLKSGDLVKKKLVDLDKFRFIRQRAGPNAYPFGRFEQGLHATDLASRGMAGLGVVTAVADTVHHLSRGEGYAAADSVIAGGLAAVSLFPPAALVAGGLAVAWGVAQWASGDVPVTKRFANGVSSLKKKLFG